MTDLSYGGKPLSELGDKRLALAEEDVANCLLRAHAAPATAAVQLDESGSEIADKGRYGTYFERMQELAVAIAVEKARRANELRGRR